MFAPIGRMDYFRNANRGQVTVALIGENDFVLYGPFDSASHGRGSSMGGLEDINIEIIVHEDGTPNGGDANGSFSDFEEIDGLGHQAMSNAMMTTGTEMERNIHQSLWTFEDEFHHPPHLMPNRDRDL
jgi:hypothetical protein